MFEMSTEALWGQGRAGEDAEGKHADPAEAFVFPEQAHELFAFMGPTTKSRFTTRDMQR